MKSFFKRKRNYLLTGIAGLAVAVLFVVAGPLIIQASPTVEPEAEGPEPASEAIQIDIEASDENITVTNVLDKEEFRPREMVHYGEPYLFIMEIVEDPGNANKINFADEAWLHDAMDDQGKFVASNRADVDIGKVAGAGKSPDEAVEFGQVVSLVKEKQEAFFDFYDQTKTGSPFFAVTFPDGSVKYYRTIYQEVS